jgi:ornithine cyclodeaminase/alanine dehydrogenase-like protein (mu-crystallin family)
MKTWNRDETREALPFDRLIPALAEMFRQGCTVPPRHVHSVPEAGAANSVLIMPAWQPGGLLGIKTVNVFPDNARRGLPALHSLYALFDARTGEPLAMLDGDEITARRTAAASALAASLLAPARSKTLLVVGSGTVAGLLPSAYRAAMPIERVLVWARRHERAASLAARLAAEGFEARAEADLPQAVAQADVVSCATLATRPLVRGAWLRPTSHLDLIGSFTPAMREADLRCFMDARVYVDTAEALVKSGDLREPIARGVLRAKDVVGDLAGLVRGEAPPRLDFAGRTVFKSVGTALEDLAAASLAWRTLNG